MRIVALFLLLGVTMTGGVDYATGASSSKEDEVLYVTINGPDAVEPGSECMWWASISNGTPPYSFEWTKNGQTVGGDDDYVYIYAHPVFDPEFRVTVYVEDALGIEGYQELMVDVDSNADICMI